MDLEVRPQVAGITEGLAAVLALVWLHADMSHEVHVELGGGRERPGAHAALELPLPGVAVARPGRGSAGAAAGKLAFVVRVVGVVRRVRLGGAVGVPVGVPVGVAVEVRFKLCKGGALFAAVANLTVWKLWDTCHYKNNKPVKQEWHKNYIISDFVLNTSSSSFLHTVH